MMRVGNPPQGDGFRIRCPGAPGLRSLRSVGMTGESRRTPRPACADGNPPNAVLIISDDQAWGDYGFMGHPTIRTLRLDARLANPTTLLRLFVRLVAFGIRLRTGPGHQEQA